MFIMACASLKVQPKVFIFVVSNPCQSPPSLNILVPIWFILIISLVFFYLSKLLFSGFLQLKGNSDCGQNAELLNRSRAFA